MEVDPFCGLSCIYKDRSGLEKKDYKLCVSTSGLSPEHKISRETFTEVIDDRIRQRAEENTVEGVIKEELREEIEAELHKVTLKLCDISNNALHLLVLSLFLVLHEIVFHLETTT